MTVLQGTMQDGTVLPVQVDAQGRLVAVGLQGPQGPTGAAAKTLSGYWARQPWTARNSANDNEWRSVCWSAEVGLFVAVSWIGTGGRVMTSP